MKENEFFKFLEKKKDELYKLQNRKIKLKMISAKLEILKEIYAYCGFNFQKTAFLRENEKRRWNSDFNTLKKEYKNTKDSEIKNTVLNNLNRG
ncbi:MAG: hypothetical protein KAU20_00735 [Nanoarchaeota archaeon]|nr:hypothetical protein [Nanoarchaeota archaeon]